MSIDNATAGLLVLRTKTLDANGAITQVQDTPTFPYTIEEGVFYSKEKDDGTTELRPLTEKLAALDAKIVGGAGNASTTVAGLIMIAETSDTESQDKAVTPATLNAVKDAHNIDANAHSGLVATLRQEIADSASSGTVDADQVRAIVSSMVGNTPVGQLEERLVAVENAIITQGGMTGVYPGVSTIIDLEVQGTDFTLIRGRFDAVAKKLYI